MLTELNLFPQNFLNSYNQYDKTLLRSMEKKLTKNYFNELPSKFQIIFVKLKMKIHIYIYIYIFLCIHL